MTLTLECLPDFYRDEITLTLQQAVAAVITQLVTPLGDARARVRMKLIAYLADHHGLIWSARQTNYDPATTARPFYEAEALTPLNGAAVNAFTGASGGSTMRFEPDHHGGGGVGRVHVQRSGRHGLADAQGHLPAVGALLHDFGCAAERACRLGRG